MKTIIKNFIIAFVTLLFVAIPVLAIVTGTQNPNLTVSLSFHNNSVPVNTSVTADATITNNTNRRDRAVVKLTIISPSGAITTSQESYIIPARGSIINQYYLAAGPEVGQYTVILSAKDNKGTSSVTDYFSTF